MTATEELRHMLDERGVEWMPIAWNPKRETFYHAANGVGFCADEYADGVKIYTDATITPEQAIAATLGDTDATRERQDDAGTLTAEKVRELMEANSRQYQSPTDPYVWLTEYDWQAIADELNATMGSCNCTNSERTGTCHNASKVMDEHGQARFVCSECDAWIDSRMLWNPEYRNGESPWVSGCKLNFCPNCGRRIVDPTTNDVDAEVDA